MRKISYMVIVFGLLFLYIPTTFLVTGLDQSLLGVTTGESFNVEVIENPIDNMQ